MFLIDKKNIVSIIAAIIIAGGFLWAVLTPPSLFNALPFSIYYAWHSDVSSESDFIRKFDVCFAIGVLVVSYILARKFLADFGCFSRKRKVGT